MLAAMRRHALLLCLLACKSTDKATPARGSAGSAGSAAAAAKPPPERLFEAWLAAFNAADRAKLVAFHEQYFPYREGMDADRELSFRQGTGGFEIKQVEKSTDKEVEVLVKERDSEQYARASMAVEPGPPQKVGRFDVRAIPTPDTYRPQRLSEADTLKELRSFLDKQAATDKFSGAVIVAKNGTPIFSEAYGLADRDKRIKNTVDTRFRIGSMNKMFTATAIVQLAQAKKLALTDPLAKLLPKYPNATFAKKVTIHHLLTHTGGTGDIFGPEFNKHRKELRTLDDYVKLYGTRDLQFEPGAQWVYSNYGFLLLGVVIEAASKQTYYDYVRKHVFEPAGMVATSSPMEDGKERPPDRSIGYMRPDAKGWQPNTDTLPIRATSAGGGDSTVKDLLAFANALTSNKLLDAEHTKLLTTGKVDTPGGDKYAYGFEDATKEGRRCFGHNGGAPGMNGELTICDNGYTIAVLANMDPPAASRVEQFVLDRLPLE